MFYWFPRSGWKAVSKLPKEHTRNIWERCQKPRGFSWTSIRAWSLFCRKAMEWRWSSPKMLKLWIRPPGIQLGQNLLSLLAGSGSCWPILLFHHCDFSWKHINIRGGGSTHLLPPFSSPYHAESSISSGFAAGNSILNSPWCFAYTLLTEASWVGLIFCSAAAEGHFFHASISVELEALREGTMGPWMWMDVDGDQILQEQGLKPRFSGWFRFKYCFPFCLRQWSQLPCFLGLLAKQTKQGVQSTNEVEKDS